MYLEFMIPICNLLYSSTVFMPIVCGMNTQIGLEARFRQPFVNTND